MDQDSLLLTNERVLERIRNPSPPAVDIFEPISIVLCKNVPRNVHFSENCVANSRNNIWHIFLLRYVET